MIKITLAIIFIIGLLYILAPVPSSVNDFPPLPNSLKSDEPGDIRTPYIRAYFTDLPREEVIAYFMSQFNRSSWFAVPLPTIRLRDYPPEEAVTRVMDQLKSSYLEELVHPLRESIFISGWVPTDPRYAINVSGRHFENKITVRYYPSHPLARAAVGLGITGSIYLLYWLGKKIFTQAK